jgi:predicted RNA-binding Zn-ribbon protein involved in translation (DUF1610 family)
MGVFNTLVVRRKCPACGHDVEFRYQFVYGETWQHEYRLGDALRWGGNDYGNPEAKRVAARAEPEGCPNCGHEDDEPFEMQIDSNVIKAIYPQSGQITFPTETGYVILE